MGYCCTHTPWFLDTITFIKYVQMRSKILHLLEGLIEVSNMCWAWYWFSSLYSNKDQSIQSMCSHRTSWINLSLICPLSIAVNIILSTIGGMLCGSSQALVLLIVARCWYAIIFSWSKCIWGIIISGRRFTCFLARNSIDTSFCPSYRELSMDAVTFSILSMGFSI